MSTHENIDHMIQDMRGRLAGHTTPPGELVFRVPGTMEQELRELVREEVDRALHPGMVDPRTYLHATVRDQDGHVYRGMLYLLEPQAEELRPSPRAEDEAGK